MRLTHFEAFRPLCPVCRGATLSIAAVEREAEGQIVEAILHCGNPLCQREYPVIDGIPLLIANLRQFIADNALRLLSRRDLSPALETLVGDSIGPGSDFDAVRQQLSTYAWEHYEARPATMLAALESGLEMAGGVDPVSVLEIGCGPGGGSFALAERTGAMVLGVDLHLPMLRLAGEVLRTGRGSYPLRRVGLVYDRREFAAASPAADLVDFWACDATALPFAPGAFSLVVALNVLDAIHTPRALLESISTVLADGGKAILTSPYDWSPAATPVEGWLGGHSQRSPLAGASEPMLRSALSALRLVAERDDLSWELRLHDRATMHYRLHQLVAEKDVSPPAAS